MQEEARGKIKQEETKVLVYLSKLHNLFIQIDKYVVCKEISQGMFISTIFVFPSTEIEVFVQMEN